MGFHAIQKVDAARLPLAELANYLQLGVGETGQVRQDQELELCLRSAIQFVEGETGLSLLAANYQANGIHDLPLMTGFVEQTPVELVWVEDLDGNEISSQFRTEIKRGQWQIKAGRASFQGSVIIRAGHEYWAQLAGDLQFVTLKIAGIFYQERIGNEMTPHHQLLRLLDKHRSVRLGARP